MRAALELHEIFITFSLDLESPMRKKWNFSQKNVKVLEMEQHCTPFSKAEAITTNADHNMNIDGGLG